MGHTDKNIFILSIYKIFAHLFNKCSCNKNRQALFIKCSYDFKKCSCIFIKCLCIYKKMLIYWKRKRKSEQEKRIKNIKGKTEGNMENQQKDCAQLGKPTSARHVGDSPVIYLSCLKKSYIPIFSIPIIFGANGSSIKSTLPCLRAEPMPHGLISYPHLGKSYHSFVIMIVMSHMFSLHDHGRNVINLQERDVKVLWWQFTVVQVIGQHEGKGGPAIAGAWQKKKNLLQEAYEHCKPAWPQQPVQGHQEKGRSSNLRNDDVDLNIVCSLF